MADGSSELRAILDGVRAQWTRRAFFRSWTLGAVTAAAMLAAGLLAIWLLAQHGIPLLLVVVITGVVAGVAIAFALVPLRRPPSDRQIARFIEEQAGDLDEVLVTAVDTMQSRSGPVVDRLVADAVRAARRIDAHQVVARDTIQRAAVGAAAGTLIFLVAFALFAPSAARAVAVAGSYLFPGFYAINVTPGSVKVREGQPVTIVARIPGMDGGVIPTVTVGQGEASRSAPMTRGSERDAFTITLNNITTSFPYTVTAGSATSATYQVQVIRPVRVTRIDVTYDYPEGVGLESHTEQGGGDIFAPAGTKVRLQITADKTIARGQVTLDDGEAVALSGHNQVMTAELAVSKDGSYRVALNDVDGLSNDGGTEYFIRMLNDRPPDVRILRPAGDKRVSPLEEVVIEARADDDYGVKSLELIVKPAAGKEKVIPLQPVAGDTGGGQGDAVRTGAHTVYLEDLQVKPGDVVTYYARATDVGKGRRSTESRSDIFFLEVKPYEEEFVASDSQAMGSMQGQQTGLEELIAQQKDIMAATWKLDARARRGGPGAQSAPDIKAVGQAQDALKNKTAEVAADITAQLSAQRRRLPGQARTLSRPGDEPLPKAIEAMGRAAGELDRLHVTSALPHEEQALAELLKAAAEIRRRQVAMQQARGGGGNGNRDQPDLSTLFDQELRKRQATNYEQQSTTEDNKAQEQKEEDPLAEIRELARRQESLSQQQRDLANRKDQLNADDIKRQLERLTRDQEALRQQADELSKKLQQQQQANRQAGQQAGGQTGQQGSQSDQMREVANQMRSAAGDLRNQDPKQASARGSKAGEQLRGLEQQMQGARPEERRRAMGDLQLEARQIADAQRRVGSEASRTASGSAGDDARRRLAAEQDRLADRTQRLNQSMQQLGANGSEGEKQAIAGAGKELEKQDVAGRMRRSAESLRQSKAGDQGDQKAGADAGDMARALDKVADQLEAAAGDRDAETAKLSEQLGQAQELRDRLGRLQRSMDELAKGEPGADPQQRQQQQQRQQAVQSQMREAQQLAEQMGRAAGKEKAGTTPEDWQRSFSAPGTEAFKQDFAKWESLKKNLLTALDQTESQLSDQLRARENRERLNAGRHDSVADTYRDLVDRYYQSLAVPRKSSR